MKLKKKSSPAGNRTPVSRVTGGDTYHYTTEDTLTVELSKHISLPVSLRQAVCFAMLTYILNYNNAKW